VAMVPTVISIACLHPTEWQFWVQYALDLLTVGGWNPMLIWWSANRPLWFISLLLSYHYVAPRYLSWLRKESTSTLKLWIVLISLYLVRTATHLLSLWVIFTFSRKESPELAAEDSFFYDHSRLIHTWTPCQVCIPFMGATLYQISERYDVEKIGKVAKWILTDTVTVLATSLCIFIPSLDNEYWSPVITLSDLFVGPLFLIGVYLYQFDQNTLVWLYRTYSGCSNLFDAMISLSYTLYLTHWPLMFVVTQYFGYFSEDSTESVIALTVISILFALFCRLFFVLPLSARMRK